MSHRSLPEVAPEQPRQPRPSRRAPRKASRKLTPSARIAVSVAAVLVGVSAIIYLVVSVSSGGHSKGNSTAADGAVASGQQGGSAGESTSGSTGAGASAASNTPKPLRPRDPAAVSSWSAGAGGNALSQVTTRAGTVLMAHGASQYPEMKAACVALASAVTTAQDAPALPDATMQREYQISLDTFKTGAAECQAAIAQHAEGVEDTVTNVNSALMKTAVAKIGTGMSDLYIATDMVRTPVKKS
jgi:hypothetical protein